MGGPSTNSARKAKIHMWSVDIPLCRFMLTFHPLTTSNLGTFWSFDIAIENHHVLSVNHRTKWQFPSISHIKLLNNYSLEPQTAQKKGPFPQWKGSESLHNKWLELGKPPFISDWLWKITFFSWVNHHKSAMNDHFQ